MESSVELFLCCGNGQDLAVSLTSWLAARVADREKKNATKLCFIILLLTDVLLFLLMFLMSLLLLLLLVVLLFGCFVVLLFCCCGGGGGCCCSLLPACCESHKIVFHFVSVNRGDSLFPFTVSTSRPRQHTGCLFAHCVTDCPVLQGMKRRDVGFNSIRISNCLDMVMPYDKAITSASGGGYKCANTKFQFQHQTYQWDWRLDENANNRHGKLRRMPYESTFSQFQVGPNHMSIEPFQKKWLLRASPFLVKSHSMTKP